MAEEIGLPRPMENVSGIPFDSDSNSGYIFRFHFADLESRVIGKGKWPEATFGRSCEGLGSSESVIATGAKAASVHCDS